MRRREHVLPAVRSVPLDLTFRVDPDALWEFVEKELEALERKIRSLKPEKKPG